MNWVCDPETEHVARSAWFGARLPLQHAAICRASTIILTFLHQCSSVAPEKLRNAVKMMIN